MPLSQSTRVRSSVDALAWPLKHGMKNVIIQVSYYVKGEPVLGESGDLVCVKPFPCMPVFFWDDDDRTKYKKAYFDTYPGNFDELDWSS